MERCATFTAKNGGEAIGSLATIAAASFVHDVYDALMGEFIPKWAVIAFAECGRGIFGDGCLTCAAVAVVGGDAKKHNARVVGIEQ